MIDNHDAVRDSLVRFLIAEAPPGAERDVENLRRRLEAKCLNDYIGLEFRPTQDVSCQLYVRVQGLESAYGSTRVEDAEGNLWHAYKVRCEVSWPTWGSDSVEVCQRRLALMTEVTRFACEVQRAFPHAFHELVQTAAEREAYRLDGIKMRATSRVVELVKKNAKGMKVGQERIVPTPDGTDLLEVLGTYAVVPVERSEAGRTFKYRAVVTATTAFSFTRVA